MYRDGRYLYDFEKNVKYYWTPRTSDHLWGSMGISFLNKKNTVITHDGDSTVLFWKPWGVAAQSIGAFCVTLDATGVVLALRYKRRSSEIWINLYTSFVSKWLHWFSARPRSHHTSVSKHPPRVRRKEGKVQPDIWLNHATSITGVIYIERGIS